ncbi:MAG: hypothetical protein J6W10_04835 [Kiritimatiellae bacterium]|nr:hypothetical protein [Kiritimatiellia bacterium]
MKINGKEYGFKLTVGASVQIAKLCPGGDLSKISTAIGNGYGEQAEAMALMIVALNHGYAAAEEFAGRKANRLVVEDVLSLSLSDFADLSVEAIKAFQRDVNGEIEVETEKKAGAEG